MSFWKRIKKAVNHYLERMAKSNKELFGGGWIAASRIADKVD